MLHLSCLVLPLGNVITDLHLGFLLDLIMDSFDMAIQFIPCGTFETALCTSIVSYFIMYYFHMSSQVGLIICFVITL